jgi:hypothetical protein
VAALLQAAVEQVRTENRHLESILDSLKAKHLEELQLLEESYRYYTFTSRYHSPAIIIVCYHHYNQQLAPINITHCLPL